MPNFVQQQPTDFSGAGDAIGQAIMKARLLRQQQDLEQQKLALSAQNAQSLGDYRQSQIGFNRTRTLTEQQKMIKNAAELIARSDLGNSMVAGSGIPGTGTTMGPPSPDEQAQEMGLRGIAGIGNNPSEMANALKTILATRASGLATDPTLARQVLGAKPIVYGPDRSQVADPVTGQAIAPSAPVKMGMGQTLVQPDFLGGTEVGSGRFNVASGALNKDPNTGVVTDNPKPDVEQKYGTVGAALIRGLAAGEITKGSVAYNVATNYLNMISKDIQKKSETTSQVVKPGVDKVQPSSTATNAPNPNAGKVMVVDPQGKKFWLPAGQLDEAVGQGYKQVQP